MEHCPETIKFNQNRYTFDAIWSMQNCKIFVQAYYIVDFLAATVRYDYETIVIEFSQNDIPRRHLTVSKIKTKILCDVFDKNIFKFR